MSLRPERWLKGFGPPLPKPSQLPSNPMSSSSMPSDFPMPSDPDDPPKPSKLPKPSNSRTSRGKERKQRRLPNKLRDLPDATLRFKTLYLETTVAPSMAPGSSQSGNVPIDEPTYYSTTPSPQDSPSTDEIQENTDTIAADANFPTLGQGSYDYGMQPQPAIDNHTFIPNHLVEPAVVNQNRVRHGWQVQMGTEMQYQPSVQDPQHSVGITSSWIDPPQTFYPQNTFLVQHAADHVGSAQKEYPDYSIHDQGPWAYQPQDGSGSGRV